MEGRLANFLLQLSNSIGYTPALKNTQCYSLNPPAPLVSTPPASEIAVSQEEDLPAELVVHSAGCDCAGGVRPFAKDYNRTVQWPRPKNRNRSKMWRICKIVSSLWARVDSNPSGHSAGKSPSANGCKGYMSPEVLEAPPGKHSRKAQHRISSAVVCTSVLPVTSTATTMVKHSAFCRNSWA